MEYVGQVMVKSVKKRRFLEYVSRVTVKDADGQEIVTKGHKFTRKVKYWAHDKHTRVFRGCGHRVSTNLVVVYTA